MSGRVVLALTESQAIAMARFTQLGAPKVLPQNVPGTLKVRRQTFAALLARGWIRPHASGAWVVTDAGREVGAVARRLALPGGTPKADQPQEAACAA